MWGYESVVCVGGSCVWGLYEAVVCGGVRVSCMCMCR